MEIKIAIGVPSNRLIKPKTASSLLKMIASNNNDYYFIISTRGYNTSENRNHIAAQAVKNGCTHLLFIDDDMIFPEDTLGRLLDHDKDIVGGVYLTKYEQQAPVLEYLDDNRPTELFKCGAIGTGCLLIKTDVFKKIPQNYKDNQGWFNYKWNDNGSVKMSHDWLFCYNARELGFEIWADPTIEIKHIGLRVY